jgi:hypothetical protein
MIKAMGPRRLLVLFSLIGVNALLAAIIYLWIVPQTADVAGQLSDVKGKVNASRSNTQQLRTQYDLIQKQKEDFGKLQATGFFTAQDRVEARQRIEAIQRYSHVLQANYNIKRADFKKTDDLTTAGQVMLSTPVTVSVDALDDMDFYNFLYLVQNTFPGFAGINAVDITRVKDLDDVTLRQIGSGIPTPLIKGNIDFTWQTVVPDNALPGAPKQTGM